MAHYVDGFVIPVQRRKIAAYLRMAKAASKIWIKHGALEFRECVGDDLHVKWCLPFPRGIKTKPGETVVFSWIVFKSRAHRNQVGARVMKDPAIQKMMQGKPPFDSSRMLYGGFETRVEAHSSDGVATKRTAPGREQTPERRMEKQRREDATQEWLKDDNERSQRTGSEARQ